MQSTIWRFRKLEPAGYALDIIDHCKSKAKTRETLKKFDHYVPARKGFVIFQSREEMQESKHHFKPMKEKEDRCYEAIKEAHNHKRRASYRDFHHKRTGVKLPNPEVMSFN